MSLRLGGVSGGWAAVRRRSKRPATLGIEHDLNRASPGTPGPGHQMQGCAIAMIRVNHQRRSNRSRVPTATLYPRRTRLQDSEKKFRSASGGGTNQSVPRSLQGLGQAVVSSRHSSAFLSPGGGFSSRARIRRLRGSSRAARLDSRISQTGC